jgi:hypothetical protein
MRAGEEDNVRGPPRARHGRVFTRLSGTDGACTAHMSSTKLATRIRAACSAIVYRGRPLLLLPRIPAVAGSIRGLFLLLRSRPKRIDTLCFKRLESAWVWCGSAQGSVAWRGRFPLQVETSKF